MDPRTFLPAGRVPVGSPPEPGELAPELPGIEWTAPTVVAFLRHVGCPFAEATFRELAARADSADGVRFVAVSQAPAQATQEWCQAVAGGPGRVTIVVDPDRAIYGRWGLGPGSLAHFLGPRSLKEVMRLARRGVRNRHPVGTRWQTAGTFGVDAGGQVRFVHVPAHAGDLPDLDGAVAAVYGADGTFTSQVT